MRARLTTALELAGFALIGVGVFMLATPAGFVVAGVALVAVGAAEGRR